MRIEIYSDKAASFRWRLVASNGKTIADSGEGYVSLSNARRAARSFKWRAFMARITYVQ
jgi:uncharacterized protein YegP (UPF0339 family)